VTTTLATRVVRAQEILILKGDDTEGGIEIYPVADPDTFAWTEAQDRDTDGIIGVFVCAQRWSKTMPTSPQVKPKGILATIRRAAAWWFLPGGKTI
jgi:hypothetical protein